MTLLERYIFRRALFASIGSLVSLVLIVWVVQALSRVDIVKTSASAAGNIFWIALMLLPTLLAGVVPFAVLIGSIQALNGLNADSERAAIAASGAPNRVVARPIILLGLLGGILMLFISHVVGPAASSAFQNGIRSINADTITLFLQPGRFERVGDGLVISVGATRGSTVSSLFINDTRDPALELSYFAREAAIIDNDDQQVLMLFDGQLHRKNASSGAVSIIEFQTYAFDLADLKPAGGREWIRRSERSTLYLLDPDPNDTEYQNRPNTYVEELTERFSSWIYSVVFALWAVAVAGQPQTNRQTANAAMTLGIAGAAGLQALGFVVLSFIEQNPLFALGAFALPLLAAIIDLWLVVRSIDPRQMGWLVWLMGIPSAIGAAIERVQGRRLATGEREAGQ